MARVTENPAGLVLILEHEDITKYKEQIDQGRDITATVGGILGVPAPAVGVLAGYISVMFWLIQHLDAGNGVYLTVPWAAIYLGAPGTIVPTPRPINIGPGLNWVARGSGQFMTEDRADLVAFRMDQGVTSPAVVDFVLEAFNPGMWAKVLVMPDGQGSQWDIAIDPSQGTTSATNGLWAGQVANGQALSLWKAKGFGIHCWVLDLFHLEGLQPGSRVTFTWLQD